MLIVTKNSTDDKDHNAILYVVVYYIIIIYLYLNVIWLFILVCYYFLVWSFYWNFCVYPFFKLMGAQMYLTA